MAVSPDAKASASQQQIDQLRAQLLAGLTALYGAGIAADMLTNPAELNRFLRRLVSFSLPLQAAAVRNQVQGMASELPLDRPILIKPTNIIGAKLRGEPMERVYARAVYAIEDRLDAGDEYADAIAYGQHRLIQTAETDLQLARTHASQAYVWNLQETLKSVRVGTRRQLSNKPTHCALCILASTQIYQPDELMPIHPGCGCTPRIVMGDENETVLAQMAKDYDNIHDIIQRDLGDKYVDSGGRKGLAPYKDIIVTHEHGEIGPVLAIRDQHFEGPTDAPIRLPVPPRGTPIPTHGDSHVAA